VERCHCAVLSNLERNRQVIVLAWPLIWDFRSIVHIHMLAAMCRTKRQESMRGRVIDGVVYSNSANKCKSSARVSYMLSDSELPLELIPFKTAQTVVPKIELSRNRGPHTCHEPRYERCGNARTWKRIVMAPRHAKTCADSTREMTSDRRHCLLYL
jgi:hypothetical protein